MNKSLDIDYYKSGYTVDHISCIEVSIAGATGFYDYNNYFYYSFYYSLFENWTKFKEDYFLALRNRALNKIGLILKPNKVSNVNDLISTIKCHINNNHPLIMIANYSTLFYYPEYLENNINHAILISDYNSEKKVIGIRENLFTRNLVNSNAFIKLQLTNEMLSNIWKKSNAILKKQKLEYYSTIYSLEKNGDSQIRSYTDIINDFVTNYNFENDFFIECIENCYDQVQIDQRTEMVLKQRTCNHLTVFFDIVEKAFEILKTDNNKKNLFDEFKSKYLYKRSIIFSKLQASFCRGKMLSEDNKEEMIQSLRTLNNDFYNIIYSLFEDEVKNNQEVNNERIMFLDLSNYFNSKVFGTTISLDCKAKIVNSYTYILTEGLPDEKIWDVSKMKFNFPDVYGNNDDNIVCKNQTIPINTINARRKYKKIMILGFSEYGSFIEPLEIKFINGLLEKVTICFSNLSRGPIYGETVAWKGKAVKRNANIITIADYEPHIFANTYYLKTDGIIESMRLPGCSNIHILAISLG